MCYTLDHSFAPLQKDTMPVSRENENTQNITRMLQKGKTMDAVILAAGNSTRFGENKLLYLLDGKPVYRYMLELLYQKQKEHRLRHIVLVSQYEQILNDVVQHFKGVQAVRNPKPEQGISSSLRLGLACLLRQEQEDRKAEAPCSLAPGACLFAVADQPGFTALSLEKLLDFWQSHSYGIVAAGMAKNRADPSSGTDTKHSPVMKNPVIFSAQYYHELLGITGDAGGKQVIRRHWEDTGICSLPAADLDDLDTKEALRRFRQRSLLAREFPFLRQSGHVISIVGAGGKTTLMETLAACCADFGKTSVITTTTRIMRPKKYPTAQTKEQLASFLKQYPIVAAGADAPEGKLRMSEQMSVSDYQKAADFVWIEADGAKHLPCKAPIGTEPVIPKESDIVLGVAGMDALDMPLGEVCFRKEKAMALLGVCERHRMTEQDLAQILISEQGTRKDVGSRAYYIVLNKCDDAKLRERAESIKELLLRAGAEHVACISCIQGSIAQ